MTGTTGGLGGVSSAEAMEGFRRMSAEMRAVVMADPRGREVIEREDAMLAESRAAAAALNLPQGTAQAVAEFLRRLPEIHPGLSATGSWELDVAADLLAEVYGP